MAKHASLPQFYDAYDFYRQTIIEPLVLRQKAARSYGFTYSDLVSSDDWEIFCAILLDRDSPGGSSGADLIGVEVKSSKDRNSFEYQYHRDHGLTKLYDDAHIHHAYVSYAAGYDDITIRLVRSEKIHDSIRAWRPGYIETYSGPNPRDRYRPNISYGFVNKNGIALMEIRGGKIEQVTTATLSELLSPPLPCHLPGCLADKK